MHIAYCSVGLIVCVVCHNAFWRTACCFCSVGLFDLLFGYLRYLTSESGRCFVHLMACRPTHLQTSVQKNFRPVQLTFLCCFCPFLCYREIDAMKGVAAAYKARDLHEFEKVREEHKAGVRITLQMTVEGRAVKGH